MTENRRDSDDCALTSFGYSIGGGRTADVVVSCFPLEAAIKVVQ